MNHEQGIYGVFFRVPLHFEQAADWLIPVWRELQREETNAVAKVSESFKRAQTILTLQ